MISLNSLKDTSRPRKNSKRVGRGIGSGKGKTCGRGVKGAGSRSGYTRRLGYEGGQMRLFMKLPIRGFNNTRFRKRLDAINLAQIEEIYQDGEIVNVQSLRDKGFISGECHGIKVLGDGVLTKKVRFEVSAVSKTAQEKLQSAKIALTLI